MKTPANIQLIGNELAIAWSDGLESYLTAETLRASSPSAETKGEKDIFGNQYGGNEKRSFKDVKILRWEVVGDYALRFDFSDGHRTGIYSYDYLRDLHRHP